MGFFFNVGFFVGCCMLVVGLCKLFCKNLLVFLWDFAGSL